MVDAVEWKFKAEWYDERSGVTKDFVLTYYVDADESENEISLFDIKARRLFLKRTVFSSITTQEMYIGNKILVFSRQLKLIDYADDKTKQALGHGRKTFLCDIPPQAFKQLGEILTAISHNNFTVTKLKTVQVAPTQSFVLCQVVGKTENSTQDPWLQVFDNCALPIARAVNVSEPNEESNQIFNSSTSTAVFDNCSLLLIKPHAVKSGFAGEIIATVLNERFQISALEMFALSRSEAENFTEVYKGVLNPQEYSGMITQLCGGSCIAVELRSEHCVQTLRDLCGPHDVQVAKRLRPKSLRAQFGTSTVENAVHCTDLPEDGVLECQYFFDILVGLK